MKHRSAIHCALAFALSVPLGAAAQEAQPPVAQASDGERPGSAAAPIAATDVGVHYDLETGRFIDDAGSLPFRNTFFLWQHIASLNTFLPNGQLTYNPSYHQAFSLRPRWYLGEDISIRMRQDLYWQVTPQAPSSNVRVSDLPISLADTSWFTLPGDVVVGGGVSVIAPVSEASRGCNLVMGLGGNLAVTKAFEEVLSGFALQAHGGLRGNIHHQDTCSFGRAGSAAPIGEPGPSWSGFGPNDNLLGAPDATVIGQVGALLTLAFIPQLSLTTSYTIAWAAARGGQEFMVPCEMCPGGSETIIDRSARTSAVVRLSVDLNYLITTWVNVALSYGSFNMAVDPSGGVYNPFNNNQSAFTLTASIFLDRVYEGVARPRPSPAAD